MPPLDLKGLLILMLAGTICVVILLIIGLWLFIGPERVPPVARERMGEIISLVIGMLAGYLMGRGNGAGPKPS